MPVEGGYVSPGGAILPLEIAPLNLRDVLKVSSFTFLPGQYIFSPYK